jgi:ABC-type multidrug transport system fused ATPase/permease subunit
LICICRSILRHNKIVILDEATANIDVVTEQRILELISTEFKDATMITIAHRMNTIIQSDKVLILSQGEVLEFGDPKLLMADS